MNEIMQSTFNYEILDLDTSEFLQHTAHEIRILVKRSAEDIVMIGIHLDQAKERLGHGKFMGWVQSEFEMSQTTAQKFMRVASMYAKFKLSLNLPASVLYELSAPSTPENIVEQVQSGEVAPTLDAIREAKEAQKKAEESERQAHAKAEATQQELFQSRAESHNVIVQLSKQIEDLQSQISTISTPEKVIVEKEVMPADYTEKQAELKKLIAEKAKLTEQRNKLRELTKELGKDLDTLREANEAKRAREIQEARILQNWREVTNTFHRQVLKLLTQFPTPIDTQIFEAEDWERLSQVEGIARRFLAECETLSNRSTNMVIDAG